MLFSGISGLIGCQNRVQNDRNCVGWYIVKCCLLTLMLLHEHCMKMNVNLSVFLAQEMLLLKATSTATLSCLEQCLSLLQRQVSHHYTSSVVYSYSVDNNSVFGSLFLTVYFGANH